MRKQRERTKEALHDIKETVMKANYDDETKKNLLACATRLNDLLDERDLTNLAFAKQLEMNDTAIGNYRKGKNLPEISILIKIADALDVPVDYLLGRTDVKDLNKDDYNKKFGFNDVAVDTLLSVKNKEVCNILFDNDEIDVNYWYEQIQGYKDSVQALKEFHDANADVDTEYDKEYNKKYFELLGNVDKAKFGMHQAQMWLVDKNIK